MSEYLIQGATLTSIADAIRAKTGSEESISVSDMAAEIEALPSGGGDSSEVEASFKDVLEGTYTTKFEWPKGLINIRDHAFRSHPYLSSISSIPKGITSIGSYSFYDTKISIFSLPETITSIGSCAFSKCSKLSLTSLPEGLTSIGNETFGTCTRLSISHIPDGVTSIGTYAFDTCKVMPLSSLPKSVTSIGNYAFRNCYNMNLTRIPAGVTSIGSNAFYNCSRITEITFEGTPKSINSTAFYKCDNLLTINVPWAEGEVVGAPWGAANATVNYNYVEQEKDEENTSGGIDKYSWKGVAASIKAGTYTTDYAVGDLIPLDLGYYGLINMQIAAFDTDELADGSGKAHISFIALETMVPSIEYNIESDIKKDDGSYVDGTGSVGGWPKCYLRKYMNEVENVRLYSLR